jgi:hypothetical protein
MPSIRIPADLQQWIEARKRFHLSNMQVQMARELGLNPKKLGKLDNHEHEPWKMPLAQYIKHLYFMHFGKESPDVFTSIEERARQIAVKKAAKHAAKRERQDESRGKDQLRAVAPYLNGKS